MPTFPVDLTDYLGTCAKVEQQFFDLTEGLSVQHQTAGGEIIRMGGSARLWRGAINLYPLRYTDARALHAKLRVLAGPGASFYVGDVKHDGAGFAAQVRAINLSSGIVSLDGGPVGRQIRAGDYISFNYGGRRAFHQVVNESAIFAGGISGNLEVVPHPRPGWAAGAPVTVGPAKCLAVMVPGSLRVGTSGPVATGGASFEWIQTLGVI